MPVSGLTPGLTNWWARRSRTGRMVISLLGAVVAALVLLDGVGSSVGGGGAPASSSLSTAADGYAALASLLAGQGHPVTSLRPRLDQAGLVPGTTVVVADAVVSGPELAALGSFVRSGGRAVLAGDEQEELRQLVDPAIRWGNAGAASLAEPVGGPSPLTAGVGSVQTTGGIFTATGRARPVLDSDGRTVEAEAALGRGEVVMLADSPVWSNQALARSDNALLALDAVGAGERVDFAEAGHVTGSGLGALPGPWRVALILLFLAWLAWVWSSGRRTLPAVPADPDAAPARILYVESMAAALRRAGQPGPVADLLRPNLVRQEAVRGGDDAPGSDTPEEELMALARDWVRTHARRLPVGAAGEGAGSAP